MGGTQSKPSGLDRGVFFNGVELVFFEEIIQEVFQLVIMAELLLLVNLLHELFKQHTHALLLFCNSVLGHLQINFVLVVGFHWAQFLGRLHIWRAEVLGFEEINLLFGP